MLEEVNVQYLKELQTEKESLESSATEEILKGHALKLLENGNFCKNVFKSHHFEDFISTLLGH
jgi:hypothetical protein